MTRHFTVAQIVELHATLEKFKEGTGRWNKSQETLRREHEEAKRVAAREKSPQKVPHQRKTA